MRETKIEGDYRKYAKSLGCLVYKLTCPGRRNVPDRLTICPNGVCIFIEFKRPKKTPTDGQWREIKRLRALGHYAYWANKPGQAEKILNEILSKEIPV